MHSVQWTPEKVRRFWDFSASRLADVYFAKLVGHSVVRYASRRIRIGTALDLGCGEGDLIGHLLQGGHTVVGSDQSPESVSIVNGRFSGSRGFKGAFVGTTGVPKVDTVFMLEVVEHMDDETLDAALSEAAGLLREGGHILITTPNDEDLDRSAVICPDCGCTFHRMQHVRSWTAESLQSFMEARGFQTVSCEATHLTAHRGWKAPADAVRSKILRRAANLIYIGQALSCDK